MKVSEKSLELNVGAELLDILRSKWGMPKAYLRGLTQLEEKQEGVDFFLHLPPGTRVIAFQFKAPKAGHEKPPYRYTLRRDQHDLLFSLATGSQASVFYVFPFYLTIAKLQQDVPNLRKDTWLLDVKYMATPSIFSSQKTRTIACDVGSAVVNPEFTLERLRDQNAVRERGLPSERFASWYSDRRSQIRPALRDKPNPWLIRGLRLAIVPPAG